jgi:hypothetical protein
VPGFDFTISLLTFVGEPLLIVGFLWRAIRGFRAEPDGPRHAPVSASAMVGPPVETRLAG